MRFRKFERASAIGDNLIGHRGLNLSLKNVNSLGSSRVAPVPVCACQSCDSPYLRRVGFYFIFSMTTSLSFNNATKTKVSTNAI